MILLYNVYITDVPINIARIPFDRGLQARTYSNFEVLKYSIASMAVMTWDRAVFFIELDSNYSHLSKDLEQYIESLYKDPLIKLSRLDTPAKWRKAISEILPQDDKSDNLIFYHGNHDHIFIDSDLKMMDKIQIKLEKMSSEFDFTACSYSHWPETIHNVMSHHKSHATIERCADFTVQYARNFDAIQIVNSRLFNHWFNHYHYLTDVLRRSDSEGGVVTPDTATILPHKEIMRHFDAYTHAYNDLEAFWSIDMRVCPPLFIPEGFFENNIRISYGFNERKPGYVHVNPMLYDYSVSDPRGADLRCTLKDIPLFWQSRITDIQVAPNIDEQEHIKRRNWAVLQLASDKNFHLSKRVVAQNISVALLPLSVEDNKNNVSQYDAFEQMIENPYRKFWNDRVFWDSPIDCIKCTQLSNPPEISLIILDYNFGCGEKLIEQIKNYMQDTDDVEIIWVSISNLAHRISRIPTGTGVDIILRHHCLDDSRIYHKSVPLNAAVSIARGKTVTFIEINFDKMIVQREMMESIRDFNKMVLFQPSCRTVIKHNLHELVYCGERQALATADMNYIISNSIRKLVDNISAFSISREYILELGGFDEEQSLLGAKGGVYELFYRAAYGSNSTIDNEKPGIVSLVIHKPQEVVPFNVTHQKVVSRKLLQPLKKSSIFESM